MFQRLTLIFVFTLVLTPMLRAQNLGASNPPNVVIVITDDQGYGDLACHGDPILKTPNLDRLYQQSVRLTDYHVSPTCSPTRAALLTGHWTNRTGCWHTIMGRSLLRENEITLGQIFKNNNYATAMFGKWHLGDNYPFRPEDRGFDEVMRCGGGGVGQTPDFWNNAYFDDTYWHNGKPTKTTGFCTDVWFDYATRFVTAQKKAGKPFFAYISTNAAHGPMHAPKKYADHYEKILQEKGRKNPVAQAHFFGMIENIDDNVGRFRAFLDREGLAENTIFIFTTDNGTAFGSHNANMRGKKGSEYDGGHRVPFFVHWPAGILAGGRDVSPVTAHVDIVPTLIELCDLEKPQGVKFDGLSIKPLLYNTANEKDGSWKHRYLITDSQRVKDPIKWRKSAVMDSTYRLVNGKELYEIKSDPGQKTNIAADNPQLVEKMRAAYDQWWADIEPSFQNDCLIYLGHPQDNPATLTSHDWIAKNSTPWNQAQIRSGVANPGINGFWNVFVYEDGQYEFRLRRWPREADAAINAPLEPGADVPGVKAMRTRPGKALSLVTATLKIGDVDEETEIKTSDKESVFKVKLKKGKHKLTARFFDNEDKGYGAYYVYVEKISTGPAKRTLAAFLPLITADLTDKTAIEIFGRPDEDTGSGLHIYHWKMADGSRIILGFGGKIVYARHHKADGTTEDLPIKKQT